MPYVNHHFVLKQCRIGLRTARHRGQTCLPSSPTATACARGSSLPMGLRERDRSPNLSPISLEPESLTGNAGPTLEKGQMGPRTAAPRPRTHRRHKQQGAVHGLPHHRTVWEDLGLRVKLSSEGCGLGRSRLRGLRTGRGSGRLTSPIPQAAGDPGSGRQRWNQIAESGAQGTQAAPPPLQVPTAPPPTAADGLCRSHHFPFPEVTGHAGVLNTAVSVGDKVIRMRHLRPHCCGVRKEDSCKKASHPLPPALGSGQFIQCP
jgi:hypothetical protein